MVFLVDRLANFAQTGSLREAPSSIQDELRRAAFNWMGCAVGGSQNDAVAIALRAVEVISGPTQASVLGRAAKLDCSNTAFINCIASSVDAFDDTDSTMMLHPTSLVCVARLSRLTRRAMASSLRC
ncbi:MAG: hypothetical protein EBY24_06785 [Betaproteobacteria bacterium]|nr:hypothetical protein [Betaproteobacteria bacterium]